ncbi:MAG: DUF4097 family beta strand repeat-containing protein [Thermoanaerobaculia bacterium]|nr:DUF4097 family beta strand repeat-containing protein [Thermoanaerobaculia bacterium]
MRPEPQRLFLVSCLCLLLGAGSVLADGLERRFSVRPGGDLRIEAEGARVEIVTGGDGASVQILRRGDSEEDILDDYRIDFVHDGDRLEIEVEKKRRWRLWDSRSGLQIRVRVPQIFNVDVSTSGGSVDISDLDGEVSATTSGGRVRVAGISGPVEVRTSGGSIEIGDVEGEVSARTSGGSIHIDRAGASVVAETSGGGIRVDEVQGPIDAHTSGGSVRAFISEPPGAASSLRTSGGSVTVYLADDVGVDLDARTSGGRVASDFDVLVAANSCRHCGDLVGAINGGGPELRLRASGGGIRVLRK